MPTIVVMKIQTSVQVSQAAPKTSADIANQATAIMKGITWTYAGAENDPSITGFAIPFIDSEIPYPALHGATLREFAAKELGLDDVASEPVEDFFAEMTGSEDTEAAAAWSKLEQFFSAELSDIRVTKFGPFDDEGALAVDQGSYCYVISGISKNGDVVGVRAISAET